MAEQMTSWTFRANERWEPKYAWADWMNGKPWRLVRGTEEERLEGKADFAVPPESFRQTALNWARTHRKDGILKVRTEIVDDDTVVIQASREDVSGDVLTTRIQDLRNAVFDISGAVENAEVEITPALAASLKKEADAFRKLVIKVTR